MLRAIQKLLWQALRLGLKVPNQAEDQWKAAERVTKDCAGGVAPGPVGVTQEPVEQHRMSLWVVNDLVGPKYRCQELSVYSPL